jgi:NodT family efflux transporter outer membrane factor (OMF) lipoprotein
MTDAAGREKADPWFSTPTRAGSARAGDPGFARQAAQERGPAYRSLGMTGIREIGESPRAPQTAWEPRKTTHLQKTKVGHPARRRWGLGFAIIAIGFLGGCTVGPKYARPAAPAPPSYKELTPENFKDTDGWKQAQPADGTLKGNWWEIFNDPQLNALEEQVNVSNQNIAAAAANFLAARALVRQTRAQYYPTITANPTITNSRPSLGQFGGVTTSSTGTTTGGTGFKLSPFTDYSLAFDASWIPDFWGKIRNNFLQNAAAAQASAADLQNVRLTAQAELAVNYFEIRGQDALKRLFDETVAAYRDSLDLTQIQFNAGIASDEAVAQAETQLEATEAQDTHLGIARAQFEHAIALLVGQPASTFSLAPAPLEASPPAVPFGVPSEILQRRPDVASAERLVAQANAQIGLATAAYYPTLTLNASGGFSNTSPAAWFAWPSRFWSAGPALAETLFEGGLRRATVQQFRASYDRSVANYRETVLTAFQQVEDNLAALRLLSQEVRQQDMAVASARRNLQASQQRYQAGIDPYLNVITAQTALLTNQQTAVNLRRQQMTASVQLIEALGGGWDAAQLPSTKDVSEVRPAAQ